MLTELQERKFSAVFNSFDADNNGAIDFDDFVRVTETLCEMRGAARGSASYNALLQCFASAWEALQEVADTNRDNRVTKEEWMAFYGRVADDPDQFDHTMLRVGNGTFYLLDTDHDGAISLDEYRDFCTVYRLDTTSESLEAIFARLDRDSDGLITRQEFLQLMRDWVQEGKNVEAPANYVFGAF